ncbi:MAG: hypothetical protein ACJ788_07280 [Ktedonobacteraceae bacterium]
MSLWDEYDSQHAHTATAKQKHTRHLTEQDIVSATREWLLQDYASVYCRALGTTRLYRRCYWIDAWGIDPRANSQQPVKEQEGSSRKGRKTGRASSRLEDHPALQPIVSLSQALAQQNKPLALNGVILAAGSSRRKEVRAMQNGKVTEEASTRSSAAKSEAFALPKDSAILRASWLEIAPALLKEIEHAPAIFLLNPFGQTPFTYDDLLPLYQRTSAPTELCLLIAHKQAEMYVAAAARSSAQATTLTALLRTDRWKTLRSKEESTTFNVTGMLNLLQASIRQHFLWVQPISLAYQVRPALVEPAPYTLLFATRRKDSLGSMNDAVCTHHRRLYTQSRQGVLAEDWFAAQEYERFTGYIQQLRQRTLHMGQAQRTRRWPDLRQQLLLENFGQFTLSDYDQVICDLLLNGKVRCEWRKKPSSPDEDQRIPGNEDTLLW